MKYIHIFPVEKFTKAYVEFINKHFDVQEHYFLLYGNASTESMMSLANVCYCDTFRSFLFTFEKLLYKADKIYFHSLFFSPKILLLLYIQPWLLDKCNWIIWGGDLYSFRQADCNIKSKFIDLVKRKVVSNFNSIITLVKGDYKLAKDWYHVKGTYYKGCYLNPITLDFLQRASLYIKKDKICRIQIGNSATPENCHYEVLDMLKSFKNENIEVYCPLSYGDSKYAESVINYGFKLLGKKFIPMLDFLSPNEYCEFLGRIDIAIFNNNRQQALGNIFALAYLGKKLYLREETSMWEELVEGENMLIYKVSSISDMNFYQFSLNLSQDIQENFSKSKLRWDDRYIKCMWETIFNA